MRYRLATDDDGYFYVIPAERLNDWCAFALAPYEYARPDLPEWAQRLDSSCDSVTFENPKIERGG